MYKFILMMSGLSLIGLNTFGQEELNSEINDLQVRIVKIAPKPRAKPQPQIRQATVTPKVYTYAARPAVQHAVQTQTKPRYYQASTLPRSTVVASASPSYIATAPAPAPAPIQQAPAPVQDTRTPVDFNGNSNNYQQSGEDDAPAVATKAPRNRSSNPDFIRRVEILWGMTSSSLDGSDSSALIPGGVSQYHSSAANGMFLTDIDFGSTRFFLESGLTYTQLGAGTGYALANGSIYNYTATPETVGLNYIGVPLDLKIRLTGDEDQSSMFVKAGAIPTFMISHAYTVNAPYSYESRFGSYNTFDILFNLGIGYDMNITHGWHALAEVSAYQGMFPVLANYNVYNYGILIGLGAGYVF